MGKILAKTSSIVGAIPTRGLLNYYPLLRTPRDYQGSKNLTAVSVDLSKGSAFMSDTLASTLNAASTVYSSEQDPMTFMCWIKARTGHSYGCVFGDLYNADSLSIRHYITFNAVTPGSKQIVFDSYYPNGGSAVYNYEFALDTWYHIAVVKDTDVVYFYVNGSYGGQAAHTETYTGTAPNLLNIGCRRISNAYNTYKSKCDIKHVAWYNVALTAAEILQASLYNTTDLPAGCTRYYPLAAISNNFSGSGGNATTYGTPASATDALSQAAGALAFNGTTQYLTIPAIAEIANTTTFALCFWWKSNNSNSYVDARTGSERGMGISIFDTVNFGLQDGSGGSYTCIVSQNIKDNAWHFIYAHRTGTTLYCRVDDTYENTLTMGTNLTIGTANTLFMGRRFVDGGGLYYLSGAVADFRCYNRVLTSAEITTLYQNSLKMR